MLLIWIIAVVTATTTKREYLNDFPILLDEFADGKAALKLTRQKTITLDFVGDFNGDGVGDFVELTATTLSLNLGSRTNEWRTAGAISNCRNCIFGRLGDLNQDSFDDFSFGNVIVFGRNDTTPISDLFDRARTLVILDFRSNPGYLGIGDFNGDGVADAVAMDSSQIYIMFGSKSWPTSGSTTKAVLAQVIQIETFPSASSSQLSVASLGDINGDGKSEVALFGDIDIRIIFGANALSNSSEGLITDTAWAVGTPGDVNGDGLSDILIHYDANSYLLFGSQNMAVWNTPLYDAPTLGAVLKLTDDYLDEYHVISGTDFNGDGIADIVVSMPEPGTDVTYGYVYVFFGSTKSAWNFSEYYSDVADLTFGSTDYSSVVVSCGDINGDGLGDILISNEAAELLSFIIPGIPAERISFDQNKIGVAIGDKLVLNEANLQVSPPIASMLLRVKFTQGADSFFAKIENPGVAIDAFFLEDIYQGQIVLTVGSSAPQYTIWYPINSLCNITSEADVRFFGYRPVLEVNQLVVDQGARTPVNIFALSASKPGRDRGTLLFQVFELFHGSFLLYDATQKIWKPVKNFTQSELFNGHVEFQHDGSDRAPSYKAAVFDGQTQSQISDANIQFNRAPVVELFPIVVDEAKSVQLNSRHVVAKDLETLSEDLVIEVNTTCGHLSLNGSVDRFKQSNLILGLIYFIHDGSDCVPLLYFRASDGRISTAWMLANVSLNHSPRALTPVLQDKVVYQQRDFQIRLPLELFFDPDGDSLTLTAQVRGNSRLPVGLEYKVPNVFSGRLIAIAAYEVEVVATDPRGLQAVVQFNLGVVPFQGFDFQVFQNVLTYVGGFAAAIIGYLYWRRRVAVHRESFQFASLLRRALNLQYHDFMRFEGDVYKSRCDSFMVRLEMKHPKFFFRLTFEERQSFTMCVADALIKRGLLAPSGLVFGLYGWIFGFSVGWSRQIDLALFESQLSEIVEEAVEAWRACHHPAARWVFPVFTRKEKLRACFRCKAPVRQLQEQPRSFTLDSVPVVPVLLPDSPADRLQAQLSALQTSVADLNRKIQALSSTTRDGNIE